jgi:REP element-mobilizing transposase RayT
MPKGLRRYYGSGDLHFITCSCYQRRPWLDTDERRDLFLTILEEVRAEHRFVVLGYVVMPEHFHLLMSEPQVGTPSTAMQSVKQRFAQRVVPRHRQRRPGGTRPLQTAQGVGHPDVKIDANLAASLLRFQSLDGGEADRKAKLYAPESRNPRVGHRAGAVAMEQFSKLCLR